jgi:hypothetical protein
MFHMNLCHTQRAVIFNQLKSCTGDLTKCITLSYVFIGVGFPVHRDLIWSIVRPL